MNFRDDKVTGNVEIPDTGLSYRQSLDHQGRRRNRGQDVGQAKGSLLVGTDRRCCLHAAPTGRKGSFLSPTTTTSIRGFSAATCQEFHPQSPITSMYVESFEHSVGKFWVGPVGNQQESLSTPD